MSKRAALLIIAGWLSLSANAPRTVQTNRPVNALAQLVDDPPPVLTERTRLSA